MQRNEEVIGSRLLVEFLLDETRRCSLKLGMSTSDLLMVLQMVEGGQDADKACSALRQISSPSSGIRQASQRSTRIGEERSPVPPRFGSSKRIAASTVRPAPPPVSKPAASMNLPSRDGARVYSCVANKKDVAVVRGSTLSAELQDRIPMTSKGSHDRYEEELAKERRYPTKAISQSEKACLKHLQKTMPGYIPNDRVFCNHSLNGTPDAIIYNRSGRVVRCAEFKSSGTEGASSAKTKGTMQLRLYLSLFGIEEGDLVLHNNEKNTFTTYRVLHDENTVARKLEAYRAHQEVVEAKKRFPRDTHHEDSATESEEEVSLQKRNIREPALSSESPSMDRIIADLSRRR